MNATRPASITSAFVVIMPWEWPGGNLERARKLSQPSEAFYDLDNGAVGFFRKPVDGEAAAGLVSTVCT